MSSTVPSINIKQNEEKRILRGHYWIFKNEISKPYTLQDGDIIDILTSNGRFLCRSFYQSTGNIFARVLSFHQEDINTTFFKKRLKIALDLRQQLFRNSSVFRWIHAESDGLPGLIIDRYDSVIVIDSNCHFYKQHGQELITALKSFDGVKHIYFRTAEELSTDLPDKIICEINNLKTVIPIKTGQKTGLFLDQRFNYLYSQKYFHNANILDCFCYVGLWSNHAVQAGASFVTGIDSSSEAIRLAQRNAELNTYSSKIKFIETDVEKALIDKKEYDVVILDPPAYVKRKEDTKKAFATYQKINTLAIQCLKKEGILITCSCSHFISQQDFKEIIKRSVRNTSRKAKLLEFHGASPDHPEILLMPELSYLKCAILQIL
ncbi:MAG TPA: class I SAM-dependent rRNA methyltransferase [Candidatus Hydrogenedens sp.]|nr:class I SAM-dependent rRNA methyltransferase [Candidatus Hydrogenedens sp.]HPP58275.1 class I SAM-dependent rRNA methyltransferase [Candidatus Hydrogenedens sp.]